MKKLTIVVAAAPLLVFAAIHQPVGNPVSASAGPGLSVVTLNMAREASVDRVVRELQPVSGLRDADVLLLQEVKQQPGAPSVAAQLGARLGMRVAFSPAPSGADDEGLAILSRFPLRDIRVQPLPAYDLRFHTRARFAIAATADSPWGPVRIFNTHLDTRLNARDRLAQLASVVRAGDGFTGPKIVGGDFNSNSFYWIGHVLPFPAAHSQARDIQDYMTQAGFRTGLPLHQTTFDYLGMHLDWIWSQGASVAATHVYPLDFSDHHAVWTRLQF